MAELGNGDGSSSSFHPEQIDDARNEAASSLLQLSRGSFNHNNIAEPEDNNSDLSEEKVNGANKKLNSESGYVENGAKKLNSDSGYVENGAKKLNSESGYVENGAKKLNSEDITDGFERNNGVLGEDSRRVREDVDWLDDTDEISRKKKKMKLHECKVCERTFKSHQALGGHVISHRFDDQKGSNSNSSDNKPATTGTRRIKIICGKSKKEEDDEKDIDDSNSSENKPTTTLKVICGKSKKEEDDEKDIDDSNSSENKPTTTLKVICGKSKTEKDYKCPFCPRVFTSGQALGGHKRTHFSGGGIKLNLETERSINHKE